MQALGSGCGAEGGSSAGRLEDAPSPLERYFIILAIKACRSDPVCHAGVSSASSSPSPANHSPCCDCLLQPSV